MSQSRPKGGRVSIKLDVPVYEKLASVQGKLETVYHRRYAKSDVIDLLMVWADDKLERMDELRQELEKLAEVRTPKSY